MHSVKAMIHSGMFCNAQCGRNTLSRAVYDVMTYSKLLTLLSVFKNPFTRIGRDKNASAFVCESKNDSRARARTGSECDVERRVLIADIDEGDVDSKLNEQTNDDNKDHNEEDLHMDEEDCCP